MEKKITKREQFEAIVAILKESQYDEYANVIQHEIDILDKKSAKAKEKAKTSNAGNDALATVVFEALTDELQTINQIATIVDETPAKVQYRLGVLVKNGRAVKEQIKVEDGDKTRKVMAYKVADTDEA